MAQATSVSPQVSATQRWAVPALFAHVLAHMPPRHSSAGCHVSLNGLPTNCVPASITLLNSLVSEAMKRAHKLPVLSRATPLVLQLAIQVQFAASNAPSAGATQQRIYKHTCTS